MNTQDAPVRLRIPEQLEGRWNHAVICTYGADLAFFEQAISRKLGSTRNRVILADATMLANTFATAAAGNELQQVNGGYLATPIRSPGAAHAKLILLTAPREGRLLVGSGNLRLTGYASQGEQFTRYQYDIEIGDAHLAAFQAAKELLDGFAKRGWLDDVAVDHLTAIWDTTPWLYATAPDDHSPVRHNLDAPILDQLLAELVTRPVDRLTIHAPFWDPGCEALRRLLTATTPREVTVLVQDNETQVDATRLTAVLDEHASNWNVHPVQTEMGGYLHAKFIVATQGDRAVCLQGSANLSIAALCRTADTGNVEIVNLLIGDLNDFDHLTDQLTVSAPTAPTELSFPTPAPDDQLSQPVNRILRGSWDPPTLRVALSTPPADDTIVTFVIRDERIDVEVTQVGAELTCQPSPTIADRLDRGAPVSVQLEHDGSTIGLDPIYPYRRAALRRLLTRQTDPDQLRKTVSVELELDDDIEQLLRQLDDALVIDRTSVWRLAGHDTPDENPDEDGPTLSLDDLDWEQLMSHPRLSQYRQGSHLGTSTDEPTDLQILLGTITARLGELGKEPIRAHPGGTSERPAEPNPDFEDLSEEERAAREEERERRQRKAHEQHRRAFGRFARRFARGLTDQAFADLVGPPVVACNFIIFNHLLGLLVAKDKIVLETGIEQHLLIWEFFWGDEQQTGYLKQLHEEDQLAVLDAFEEHDADATTLAAVYRLSIATRREDLDTQLLRLRDLWRRMLTVQTQATTASTLQQAAREAAAARADPLGELTTELEGLARYVPQREVHSRIANCFGADTSDVRIEDVEVTRAGARTKEDELRILNVYDALDADTAAIALATWAHLQPERHYYRIKLETTHGVAVFDRAAHDSWWVAHKNDVLHDLTELPDVSEPWETQLRMLRWSTTNAETAA